MEIWSDKYRLCGKIDVYDSEEKALIERKTKIKTIYDGYRYQLYAQYFCLVEMGYEVEKLLFHSLQDNKRYILDLPKKREINEFEGVLAQVRGFSLEDEDFEQNSEKCRNCIYSELCDKNIPLAPSKRGDNKTIIL